MKDRETWALATETIKTAYALPDGWESLFLIRDSMVNGRSGQEWIIEYLLRQQRNWH